MDTDASMCDGVDLDLTKEVQASKEEIINLSDEIHSDAVDLTELIEGADSEVHAVTSGHVANPDADAPMCDGVDLDLTNEVQPAEGENTDLSEEIRSDGVDLTGLIEGADSEVHAVTSGHVANPDGPTTLCAAVERRTEPSPSPTIGLLFTPVDGAAPDTHFDLVSLVARSLSTILSRVPATPRVDPSKTPPGAAMRQISREVVIEPDVLPEDNHSSPSPALVEPPPPPVRRPVPVAARPREATRPSGNGTRSARGHGPTRPSGPEPALDLVDEDAETHDDDDAIERWLACLGRPRDATSGRKMYRAPCRIGVDVRDVATELLAAVDRLHITLETRRPRTSGKRNRGDWSGTRRGGAKKARKESSESSSESDEPYPEASREINPDKRSDAIASLFAVALRGPAQRVKDLCLHDVEPSRTVCNCRSFDMRLCHATAEGFKPDPCTSSRQRGPKSAEPQETQQPLCIFHNKFHGLIYSGACDLLLTYRLAPRTEGMREAVYGLLCHMLDWFAGRAVYSNQNLAYRDVLSFTRVAVRRVLSRVSTEDVHRMRTELTAASRIACQRQ